ncbi:hypothetical protein DSM104443_00786 [Usitatibacter rugosus]|uniref:Uncharacterized protein n=1 Tax=Usitatibacter rugosus TaxID=2732067 RepID=A0A6M4GRN2_9PROT|nr:hypothetical protein [Usitatibacter rugosus]QJR09736.1 hypothetical protein DSM104443_00786 [Usitatibacter rugosus]
MRGKGRCAGSRIALAVLAASLSSCVVSDVDARLESVRVVSLAEESHWESPSSGMRADQAFALKIEVSSETDLVRLRGKMGLNIRNEVRSCVVDVAEGPQWENVSDLRVSDRWLEGGEFVGGERNLDKYRRPDGRISYFLYVPLAGDETRAYRRRLEERWPRGDPPLYDPNATFADLCVVLIGRGIMGNEMSAPTLVVRREAIDEALARSR